MECIDTEKSPTNITYSVQHVGCTVKQAAAFPVPEGSHKGMGKQNGMKRWPGH
jgi:hypothetical protein